MDYDQLANAIQLAGFATKRENAFKGMRQITGTVGRLVCGQMDNMHKHFLASLWVQVNSSGEWYLGLFSGPIYKVSKFDVLPEVVIGLLSREYLEDRAISKSACNRYSLVEI